MFSAVHSIKWKWVIVKDQSVIIFPALVSCCRCAAKVFLLTLNQGNRVKRKIWLTGVSPRFSAFALEEIFSHMRWRKFLFSLKEKSKKSPAPLVPEIVGNKCASSLLRVRYSSSTCLLTCNVCLQIRVGRLKAQMPLVPQHHILVYLASTSLCVNYTHIADTLIRPANTPHNLWLLICVQHL